MRILFKWKKLALSSCLFLLLCSLIGTFQLKKSDVRTTMEEMLAYHVEYKTFSPQLAKRSLKIYLEQFDSEKFYLLQMKKPLDIIYTLDENEWDGKKTLQLKVIDIRLTTP